MPSYYAIDKAIIEDGSAPISGKCKPRQGSELIVFARTSDDILFLATTSVTSAFYDEVDNGKKWPGEVRLSDLNSIDGERPLSGLAGSLQKTRFFLEPERHFKQDVTSLSAQDFKTIVSGVIDIGRSIFRMTFHALPLQLRAEFVRLNFSLYPASEGRSRYYNYRRLAIALLDFYEERLGAGLGLLRMIEDSYPSTIEGVPAIGELFVGHGSQGTADFIALGTGSQRLLAASRETFALRGLGPKEAAGDTGTVEPGSVFNFDEGFLPNARRELSAADMGVRRRWLDSIF